MNVLNRRGLSLLVISLSLLVACSPKMAPTAPSVSTATAVPPRPTPSPVPTLVPPTLPLTATYQIVQSYPHDRLAFTEGLVYHNGEFYESTGMNNQSSLRRVEIATGKILQRIDLPGQYFGEGLALFNDQLLQLTWQNQIGFVYERATFKPLRTFSYPMPGWGMTHDGSMLIISDGTPVLHFYDPATLTETHSVSVTFNGQPVQMLNELEYVRGEVYANIWLTNVIARIDPATGAVLGWIDLTGLLTAEDMQQPVDVLNGIAYDPQGDRLFVTGKYWPKVFEIKLRGV